MKQHERTGSEVAIVGMACVLPGAADSLDAFRSIVMDGREVTGPMPPERFGGDSAEVPPQAAHGGFLGRSPWEFDPAAFSITPKEAAYMDPQHRMLLETCYHAIEDAGIDPTTLRDQRWGVFVGLSTLDYARRMASSGDYNGFLSRGALGSMAAGRIAYHFGLQGPALVIDTACSSSLVAVHEALNALAADQCDAAIVAGASLMLTHDYSVDLARAGMLAADGRCKTFTKHADGFARGEGVGAILLMRHADSLLSHKRTYANLLGSAVNSDGRSNGITAPSQLAQRRVIAAALECAAVKPSEISYIETHGTGTNLGDRIELSALAEVFSERRHKLFLGALKANIGHCEGAAGIAGLIKTALCIKERRIAPHCMAKDIDEDLSLGRFQGSIPQSPVEWRGDDYGGRLIAGVSSFGMSGTNAHVVLGEAPVARSAPSSEPLEHPAALLFLSARSHASTAMLADAYADILSSVPDAETYATCNAALATRQIWPHSTLAVVGRSSNELAAQLREQRTASRSPAPLRKVAMLFTGQGSQYQGMARGLFAANRRFRDLLTEFAGRADRITDTDSHLLSQMLSAEAGDSMLLTGQRIAQLSLFVLQSALAQFWIQLGCKPYAVVGHSVGEYAAACVAGAFDLETGMRLVLSRADAMERSCVTFPGKMISIGAPVPTVMRLVDHVNSALKSETLWLAALNAPESVVVAGTEAAILAAAEYATRQGMVSTVLATQGAFHTPLMRAAAREFAIPAADLLSGTKPRSTSTRFLSSVQGCVGPMSSHALGSVDYWSGQIERPVDFSAVVSALLEDEVDALLEIGPRPVLCGLATATSRAAGRSVVCLPSIDPRQQDDETILRALARLAEGGALSIRAAMAAYDDKRRTEAFVTLPKYPFDRTALQPASWPYAVGRSNREKMPDVHDISLWSKLDFCATLLVGVATPGFDWIDQHRIHGQPIAPAAFYASMATLLARQAISRARQRDSAGTLIQFTDLTVLRPLIFENASTVHKVECRMSGPIASGGYEILYRLADDAETAELARVLVAPLAIAAAPENTESSLKGGAWTGTESFYSEYASRGVQYGPWFRRIAEYSRINDDEILCRIAPPDAPTRLTLGHSAFIDTCIQSLGICHGNPDRAYAPIAIESIQIDADASWSSSLTCHTVLHGRSAGMLVGDLVVRDQNGRCIAELRGVTCAGFSDRKQANVPSLYRVSWLPRDVPATLARELGEQSLESTEEAWLVLSSSDRGSQEWREWLTTERKITRHEISLLEDQETVERRLGNAAPIRTIIAPVPHDFRSGPVDYAAMAEYIGAVRRIVGSVSDQRSGLPLQVCFITNGKHDDENLLSASVGQALAVQLRAELPGVDSCQIEIEQVESSLTDAIVAIRDTAPEMSPRRISTPLWRFTSAGVARCETIPVADDDDGGRILQGMGTGRYLVTGAFGGIGRRLVEHLLDECGCRALVLIVRNDSSHDGNDWVAGLRQRYRADIQVLVADLAAPHTTGDWLAERCGVVNGIFHLAGTVADRNIADTDASQLSAVLGAKLGGAWALRDLARGQARIEFLVYFSSLASLMESPGQISYAIANAGLQRLAAHDASLGMPAIVVDWGPWSDTGMMSRLPPGASSRSLRRIQPLIPQDACTALFEALRRRDLGEHFAIYAAISDIKQSTSPSAPEGASIGKDAQSLMALLTRLIATETGHPPDEITGESTLENLGLDSVGTIRIRSEIQARLAITIPVRSFFESNSVAEIHGLLVERIKETSPISDAVTTNPQPNHLPERVQLSYNQFALWYEQIRHGDSRAYNCAVGWRVTGDGMSADRLTARWHALIGEHELLRATFDDVGGEPGYVVHDVTRTIEHCPISVEDIQSRSSVDARIQELLSMFPSLPSEFATRVTVLRVSQCEWYLVVTSNHMVMDAGAIFLVGGELLRAICGFDSSPSGEHASYSGFVNTQRSLGANLLKSAREFFVEKIIDADGSSVTLDLPLDRIRSGKGVSTGGTVRVPLSASLVGNLTEMPSSRRSAAYLAAWLILLSRYSNQRRVITGLALNGRSAQRWLNTIGHFVNVLPLVGDIDEDLTVGETVHHVQRALFELVEYQDVPLAMLMGDERLRSASGSAGLFSTYFNYFDASDMTVDTGAHVQADPLRINQQEAQFDLSLWVTQNGPEWTVDLKFSDAVFNHETVETISQHYAALLSAVCDLRRSGCVLATISVMAPGQLRLLESGSGPVPGILVDTDPHDTDRVHEMFAKRAQETPEAMALEWDDHSLTYRELSQMIDTLSVMLRNQGVGAETTVGILFPRFACPESIIAILAIWKCGAAYVALDLKHPAARTAYMIDIAKCSVVLTKMGQLSDAAQEALSKLDSVGLCNIALHRAITSLECEVVRRGSVRRSGRLEPNSAYAQRDGRLAYVLFTSGSTGNPKGVLVEHLGLTQRLRWMERYFLFSKNDRFLQGTVLTFDISVPEFCLPLMTGGTVVLMGEDDSTVSHAAACVRHGVTMMSTVPSLLNLLLEQLTQCPLLRHVISVGEALMQPVVRAWLESGTKTVLHNLYGPTEATIYATYHACDRVPDGPGASIGVACEGVRYWVLDARGRPQPPGIPGELYLGGSGVARGYIGAINGRDPFCENPYQDAETRMYRTGDIVKWRGDGTLDYIGRNDFRVKIRGLLVELGEIEQVLMSDVGVRHATALVVDVGAGSSLAIGQQVIGCVIAAPFDEQRLLTAARARLPDYMVPWRLMCFESFPLNSSGKVHRKSLTGLVLSRLKQDADARRTAEVSVTLSPQQAALCALWQSHLNVAAISTSESFFQLGGDSLTLTRMVLAAERELGLKVDFSRFVANPSIDGFLSASTRLQLAGMPVHSADENLPYTADLAATLSLPTFNGSSDRAAEAYLLTGATGHLGMWLLRELLEETAADIYLLVRDAADPSGRVVARYRAMFGAELPSARVRTYRGDVTLPKFGLSDEDYEHLLTHITQIIHAAAHVNHAADYMFMRNGNVAASRHVLEFSSDAKIRHVHYISTQYTELTKLPEQWLDSTQIQELSSGYERSKFVAEAYFTQAARRGYPASIYRLPLLIDDRDQNLFQQNHFVAFSMKCLAMGVYPDVSIPIPIIPTEYVATYIVHRSKMKTKVGVRNAYLGTIDFRAIAAQLGGGRLRPIPPEEWVVRAREQTSEAHPFFRMLPLYSSFDARPNPDRAVDSFVFLSEAERLGMRALELPHDWLLETVSDCINRVARLEPAYSSQNALSQRERTPVSN